MTPLHPYQVRCKDWLLSRPKNHGYLAAAMGLGKCAITLHALKEANLFPAIIICPEIVREHWKAETFKWLGIKAHIFDKTIHHRNTSDIAIVGYYRAQRSYEPTMQDWKCMVFDEAHYLKSPDTIRTKRLLLNKDAFSKRVPRIWMLSGTPTPNNVSELWAPFNGIGTIEESFNKFTERYCEFERVYVSRNRVINKIKGSFIERMPELRSRLNDSFLRLKAEDARIDLPSVVINEINVAADKQHTFDVKEQDQDFHRFFTETLEKSGDIKEIINKKMGVKSFAGLRRLHGLRKAKPTAELIAEELESGLYKKIVAFGHHNDVLVALQMHLNELKINSVLVNGLVSQADREERILKFQTWEKIPVMIASIQATGIGINLHASNQVIFIEMSYVPAENAQAIARCARLGQNEKTVFVRTPTLSDSEIDRRIAVILNKKVIDLKAFEGQ